MNDSPSINTTSNTYALQDIFSDKRVGNPSGNKEDIEALQNIIQSKLPSAVKAFFQTLWECIAHSKSWNEGKLTVALNNANIGDKVTIWDTMVNNLSHFNPESQEKLSNFVKKTMLADGRETSQNPSLKEQAMDVARKLPFDTSFQAKLTLALNDPDCYEKVQNINEFAINIHDNYDETFGEEIKDYDLATTDTQDAFKGKNEERLRNLKGLLEKKELYNYVNGSSESPDKAVFDEFYKIFKDTKIWEDSIQRGGTIFEIGNQSIKVGPEYKIDDKDKDQRCKRQTKELLKALVSQYESAQSTLKVTKANYLFNFIKRFHASVNSPSRLAINKAQKTADKYSSKLSNYLNNLWHNNQYYSGIFPHKIDKNGIMYSTIQLCFDEKRCKNWIKENRPKLTKSDINFLEHFAAAMVITTKTDLKDPDEKIDVSCYWRAGTTREENMTLGTPLLSSETSAKVKDFA